MKSLGRFEPSQKTLTVRFVTVNKQVDNEIEHIFIYIWALVLVCVQRKK